MTHDIVDPTRAHLEKLKRHDFARWCSALFEAEDAPLTALKVFARRWPRSEYREQIEKSVFTFHTKAEVGPGTIAADSWGTGFLPTSLQLAFSDYARSFSLIGRIAGLRRIPFRVPVAAMVAGASGFQWAGGANPKPVSAASLARANLAPAVGGLLIVVSQELIRLWAPGSEQVLTDDLAAGVSSGLDRAFVDPAIAATDFSPASITFGVSPIASTGDVSDDLALAIQAFIAAGGSLARAVVLLSSQNAAGLALRRTATGNAMFTNLTVSGGTLAGLPLVCSDALGDQLVIFDPARVAIADDGGVDIGISQQTSVQMESEPGGGSPAIVLTSMWTTNSAAIRVERFLNWERLGNAIAVVDGADYLTVGSP